jgi:hypothetical protein
MPAPPDRAAAYPLSFAEQIALPGAQGEPDSVVVTMSNLAALSSGAYKLWYANPTTNQSAPATGKWVRVVGTDTVESGQATSTFNGGPGQIIFTTDAYGAIGAPDISDSLSTLIVTVEADAGAAAPSSAQPFWVTVLKTIGGSVGGTFPFGEFTFADDSRSPELFRPQGKLSGGVIGNLRGDVFVGSEIEVTFTGLMRPPLGYQYRAYLCASDTGTCAPDDPSTTYLALGGLTAPSGASLDNADADPNDSNLSSTRVVSALASAQVSGAQTLCDFDRFRLVLEPKGATGLPQSHVFDALLPAKVRAAESCQ